MLIARQTRTRTVTVYADLLSASADKSRGD
jgi:hypothetical protein